MGEVKSLSSKMLYRGKVFNLIVDDVEYPSGRKGIREVADHPGGAVIVPFLDDQTLLLVRQFRYPFRHYVLELPAGKLEPQEDPLHCAQRELEEETGYVAATWNKLAAICTTPGFCNEVLHLFVARDLRPSPNGQLLEEGEASLLVEHIRRADALQMIQDGKITDAKTLCGILLTSCGLQPPDPRQQLPKSKH